MQALKNRTALCLILILIPCVATAQTEKSAQIEKNNRPAAAEPAARELTGIILPAQALPAERHAAEELSRCLKQISGQDWPILSEKDTRPAGRSLQVGRTQTNLAEHNPDAWPPDTIYLGYGAKDIAIIGQGAQGTLFAAYEFLRDLGCRWYLPMASAEIIPQGTGLKLPQQPRRHTPSFKYRGWWGTPASAGVTTLYLDWAVRNNLNAFANKGPLVDYPEELGYGAQFREAHTLIALIPSGDHPDREKTFAAHPDWYPLVNGQRVWQYTDGRPVQACLSNQGTIEEVARKVIAYLQENPHCRMFSIAHNDEPSFWCECESCLQMDGKGSTWRQNNIFDAYPDRSPAGPGPMSDRYVRFANQVAQIVARQYPDNYISFYAYGSAAAPPRDKELKLEKNIRIYYSHGCEECLRHDLFDTNCQTNADLVKWLGGWRKLGEVIYYDYPPLAVNYELPTCFFKSYQRYMQGFKKLEVIGFSGEDQGTWCGSALFHYIKARLLWNDAEDVDRLVDEFCRDIYEDAAPEMVKFYATFENCLQQMDGHLIWARWLPQFDKKTMDVLTEQLNKADVLAKTPRARKHVNMMQIAMNSFILTVMEARGDIKGNEASFAPYEGIRSKTVKLIDGIDEPFPLVVTPQWLDRLRKSYRPPYEALGGKTVMTLPLVWKFRTDAQNTGLKENWQSHQEFDSENWKPIRVDKSWTEQGFDYHGAAWYAVEFEMPQNVEGRLWLLFEMLDGQGQIWMNERSVGDLAADPWDKPKALEISADMKSPGKYRLVARVQKESAAAGIVKPVKLILSPKVIGSD